MRHLAKQLPEDKVPKMEQLQFEEIVEGDKSI